MSGDRPIVVFDDRAALRAWLQDDAAVSAGVWVRITKRHADLSTVTSQELLEEGSCVRGSESARQRGDDESYLQRFTPHRTNATKTQCDLRLATRLVEDGAMTPGGLLALGLDQDPVARDSDTLP